MTKRKKILKISIISVCAALGLFLLVFAGYSVIFAHKNYSNQYIGNTNFGGKTRTQTKDILQSQTNDFLDKEIVLTYQNKDGTTKPYNIKPSDLGIQYNIDATADNLWHTGRTDSIFVSLWQQLQSLFKQNNQPAEYSINDDSLNKKITEISTAVDNPEKDFSLSYQNGTFVLTTERKEGERIDQNRIKDNIKYQISTIKGKELVFQTETYKPQIDEAKANQRLEEVNGILKAGNLTLQFEDQKFPADVPTIASFIGSRPKGDDMEIIYNEDKIKIFIQNLSGSINVTPQNATLTVVGGKATVFATARTGKTLDTVQTLVDIENALTARLPDKKGSADSLTINLKVDIQKPEITDDTINSLGIVELVATGTTDFKSSPSNRIHNINVGMKSISGSLIKPGEEFSTLKKLGAIDASTGYLPELVIKNIGDKISTVPDYGGGLCQVSTTLFRATLNAGLKITERTNHSYRVSYYEPPIGMDATIYDPAPDFKFVNNYNSYLLVQGRLTGTKLTFDIYGTKDARVVSISTPEAYDFVAPPAMVETQSPTLAVGQRQQVQKPHQGASAKFHYKVERSGEILQEKDFLSKYVALAEKWLVGAAATAPVPDPTPIAPTPEPTPVPTPEPVAPPVVTPVTP